MDIIDMHVHTNASDGVLSPREAVEWAARLGLRGIAITDHDTVGGIKEGLQAAQKCKDFLLIPGIEFSTFYQDTEVHILGYFIDYQNEKLIRISERIRNARFERITKMIEKLNRLGIDIHVSEVFSAFHDAMSIGRPHIARILIEKNYAQSIEEAFHKFLEEGKPAYVERFKLSVEEAINLIRDAHGISVLAHPGLLDDHVDVKEIIDLGIQGIEVYHSKHSYEESQFYLDMAYKRNLLITGGSDYHDKAPDDAKEGIGSTGVPYDFVKTMMALVKTQKI
ncbi:MAG TPA: PHP domain-containing protein [Clostridiales bacterium]|nr:PHP domain-containing protein [Clostridiales bacterium]